MYQTLEAVALCCNPKKAQTASLITYSQIIKQYSSTRAKLLPLLSLIPEAAQQ